MQQKFKLRENALESRILELESLLKSANIRTVEHSPQPAELYPPINIEVLERKQSSHGM
jgi:hypothetical protein